MNLYLPSKASVPWPLEGQQGTSIFSPAPRKFPKVSQHPGWKVSLCLNKKGGWIGEGLLLVLTMEFIHLNPTFFFFSPLTWHKILGYFVSCPQMFCHGEDCFCAKPCCCFSLGFISIVKRFLYKLITVRFNPSTWKNCKMEQCYQHCISLVTAFWSCYSS